MSKKLKEAKIFASSQSKELAEKIANAFGLPLGNVELQHFKDGEFKPSFKESLRGKRIFIIGSTFAPSDNLMEILLMIDAAKRASARFIDVVIPYFGWARQERKDEPRVPIAAKLVANMLQAAGASRVVTMDLHADPIQGFFEIPVDHLYSSTIFVPYIENLKLNNLVIASPDMGGSKRAYAYSKFLKSDVVICYKQRKKANVIGKMELIGDVKGKNVVLVDDIIDTGGTLVKAAQLMKDKGAESVRAVCTHALLSDNAQERIAQSEIIELVVTDSIPRKILSKKIKVLSCATLFADVMHNVHVHKSISSKFIM
jgi:ribose-phosphate pyrophosphokinase